MGRRARRLGVVAALLSAIVAGARAEELYFPAVIGQDDRQEVDSHQAPWNAVGRIDHAGYRIRRHCTGTLVAPDKVLTAAHCLRDQAGRLLDPERLHFRVGFQRQQDQGHATAKCFRLLGGEASAPTPSTDIAVIVLASPLDIAPVTLAGDDPGPGARVDHAGYGRDRPYALSAHLGCRVQSSKEGLVATDCDTNLGQSGGPLMVEAEGAPRLAGVVIGGIRRQSSIAVGVSRWRDIVGAAGCGD